MRLRYRIKSTLRRQAELILAERERWSYFLTIVLGTGIGVYYLLPFEPPLTPLCLGCLSLFIFYLVRIRVEQRSFSPISEIPRLVMVVVLTFFIGVTAATYRTLSLSTPMLNHKTGAVMVEGTIIDRESRGEGKGVRLILSNLKIEHLSHEKTPKLISINIHKALLPDIPPPREQGKIAR